jgi:nucleotide-binding universal stress UspA family protein
MIEGPILLATDGSPDADLAATAAAALASGWDRPLHLAHAWDQPHLVAGEIIPADFLERLGRDADELLRAEIARIEKRGGSVAGRHLLLGPAADAIVDVAAEINAGLIVIGSRGLAGFKRLLMGSVSEAAVHHTACPVLVVRGGSHAWPPDAVLAGDDGSEAAERAVDAACEIARLTGASLSLQRVLPEKLARVASAGDVRRLGDARQSAARKLQEDAVRLRPRLGFAPTVELGTGDPAAALIETAVRDGRSVLVCVGSRGLGLVKRAALGSVSNKVLRAAPGPVLICR